MAHGTQGDQLVQIEVGPTLGALDDVVDLEGAPAATRLHLQRTRRNTLRRIAAGQLPRVLASCPLTSQALSYRSPRPLSRWALFWFAN